MTAGAARKTRQPDTAPAVTPCICAALGPHSDSGEGFPGQVWASPGQQRIDPHPLHRGVREGAGVLREDAPTTPARRRNARQPNPLEGRQKKKRDQLDIILGVGQLGNEGDL